MEALGPKDLLPSEEFGRRLLPEEGEEEEEEEPEDEPRDAIEDAIASTAEMQGQWVAKEAKAQRYFYSLLLGKRWGSGAPLRALDAKLRKFHAPLADGPFRVSTGELRTAVTDPRVHRARLFFVANAWGTHRKRTAGPRTKAKKGE